MLIKKQKLKRHQQDEQIKFSTIRCSVGRFIGTYLSIAICNVYYKITLQSAVVCLILSPYKTNGIASAMIATKIPAIVPKELT